MKLELRNFAGVQVRAAQGADFVLEGVAASYGVDSNLIPGGPAGVPFVEQIQRGAFARTLRSSDDVKALFNHNPNHILGRRKNKTLVLEDTDIGLAFRCQLDQRNSEHRNLYASVKRGDIDECSFAFTVAKNGDLWNRDYTRRTLLDVTLFDVSVVANPAYPSGTSVAARSAQYVLDKNDAHYARHMAALARLAPIIEADRKYLEGLED